MPSDIIQWFPGHMAKTRRLIQENLPQVDIVIEVLDARIPYSSKNPELRRLVGQKPVLTILSKSSLADPRAGQEWMEYYKSCGRRAVFTDCVTGFGMDRLSAAVDEMLAEKRARYDAKGMTGRTLKAMIVGIPNVGKSSLINKISGGKSAKVENRPGVTLNKQWVTTQVGLDLLDMPGVLWPKFEDQTVGENLAITGAIKDDIMDLERIAYALVGRLRTLYPELLAERYKLGDLSQYDDLDDWDLFQVIGKKRGFLMAGGVVNTERCARALVDEFRQAKIGRITLERPLYKEKKPSAAPGENS
ncbi:MAG: ribosome biogenesis GTPase YlqF [Clostridia bacterium]|nr:ribosome biogenesis GTPase YlqF [Clostridia bacterium]